MGENDYDWLLHRIIPSGDTALLSKQANQEAAYRNRLLTLA